jgi:hypothetical protein
VKRVIFVQCGAKDNENSEAKETAEHEFSDEILAKSQCRGDILAHFRGGRRDVIRRGKGIAIIMRSEEMLKTALVMRWCIAAEH